MPFARQRQFSLVVTMLFFTIQASSTKMCPKGNQNKTNCCIKILQYIYNIAKTKNTNFDDDNKTKTVVRIIKFIFFEKVMVVLKYSLKVNDMCSRLC